MPENLKAEGMSEAREAFDAAMDAETPSRSRSDKDERAPSRMGMDDLFPARQMDRREEEGGAREGVPAAVKKARDEARARGEEVLDDEPPRRKAKADATPREPVEDEEEDQGELDLEAEDEDDTQPDEEQDEEDESEEAGPLDLSAVVEVNIDGQPAEVTLKEALRGYIRTETFHRRMGELQQGVQALNTHKNELDTHRQALVERAQALEEYVTAFMPQEPNWDEIYAKDPAEGARLERRWRSFQDQVAQLRTKREETQAELDARRAENLRNFAAANRAQMAQSHPEWQHEKVWRRDHDSMRRTARTAGYTDEEINQLYDARGVEVLLKASKYDRLMAAKPRPVKGPGTPTKANGATPRQRAVSRGFERAEKRLSRTGSVSDAASVFERILDNER